MRLKPIIHVALVAIGVIVASAAAVRDARAGAQVFVFGPTTASTFGTDALGCIPVALGGVPSASSARNKYAWQFAGCANGGFQWTPGRYFIPGCPCPGAFNRARDCGPAPFGCGALDNITMSGCINGLGQAVVFDNSNACVAGGQLSTSAAGDTANAKVDLAVGFSRSGSQITLSNVTGQMRDHSGIQGSAKTRFVLAVYADSTVALAADPNTRGAALFWGRVDLNLCSSPLVMTGDFGGSDFTLSTPDSRTVVATPGTINKVVTVPNINNAVVVLTGDAIAGPDAIAPGTNPAGILALAAAMAVAGLSVMARRRRRLA